LANTPLTGRHMPPDPNNTHQAAARLRAFSSAGSCARCQPAITTLAGDARALLAEVTRLRLALADARLESANRLAAMWAALGAAHDGETDPLNYLRWELPGDQAVTPECGGCE
jgi:hypothetical protein